MYVSVQNGTRAGWRTTRQTPDEWMCGFCGYENRRYLVTCLECRKERPTR